MDPGTVLNKRFQITKKVGAGSFGTVYGAVKLDSGIEVCLKVENIGLRRLQLMNEARILRSLQGGEGFASIISTFSESNTNVLVMELLGPSLEVLFKRCNRSLSLKSVLQVSLQMIDRIHWMHQKCFLHRDIKPDNFCMGTGDNEGILYIVDFGLSKKYLDIKSKLHLLYRESKSLTGTARFASLHSHQGLELSRRDDLESSAYVIIYLLKGFLPWQGMKAASKIEKYNKIAEAKAKFASASCAPDIPTEIFEMLSYIRSLRFEQQPDYSYIIGLLGSLTRKHKIVFNPYYDWSLSGVSPKQLTFSVRSTELTVGSRRLGSQEVISKQIPHVPSVAKKKARRSSVGCCSPSRSKSTKGSRCQIF